MSEPAPLPRFLMPDMGGLKRPTLHVVIDTEEEFDWNAPFARGNTRVEAIAGMHLGQTVFRRFGLAPSYMVDHPIATDPRAADTIGPWLEAGECAIGAQLHPWVNPPHEEVICPYYSYPCNLEADLEQRKLATLTAAITQAFGRAPRSYKAGRYGYDFRREPMFRALGYEIDMSVLPYRNYAGMGGGPDFVGFPDQPFWLNPDRKFMYIPVTQSLVGPLRAIVTPGVARALFSGVGSRLRVAGLLARLRLLDRINLTPEGVSLDEMCLLVREMVARDHLVFCLSMHSPSFTPGGTPYSATARDVAGLLERIERFLEFFFGRLNGQASTPQALKETLARA